MNKYLHMLPIALTIVLAAAGCGGKSAPPPPALNSQDKNERLKAVDNAAEKFGARKSPKVKTIEFIDIKGGKP